MDLISFCIEFVLSGINQLFVFVKKIWLQEEQRVHWPVALFLLWEDKHCRYVNPVYIALFRISRPNRNFSFILILAS